MNRIEQKFSELKAQQQKAFVGFVTLGDPDYQMSIQVVKQMVQNGCDMIELGLPFSDPAAEGEIIQAANLRALNKGMNTKKALALVKEVREVVSVPLVFYLYYNQIFRYGIECFFKEAAEAGIDGLIIPDLPFEYHQEVEAASIKYNIRIISLVTFASNHRKEAIALKAKGFLYCMIPFGAFKQEQVYQDNLASFMKELNQYTNISKVVSADTVQLIDNIKPLVDGIMVDNIIVEKVYELAEKKITIDEFGQFIKTLSDRTHC